MDATACVFAVRLIPCSILDVKPSALKHVLRRTQEYQWIQLPRVLKPAGETTRSLPSSYLEHWAQHPMSTSSQWIIEDAGYGFYYIKSGKGGYVSFDGVASSGSPLICSVTKQRFRIIQDSLDSSLIKCVLLP